MGPYQKLRVGVDQILHRPLLSNIFLLYLTTPSLFNSYNITKGIKLSGKQQQY